MSKVKITGHASGSGTLTLSAPNTSSDRTITLPDATGTLLNSDGSAASLTAIPAANITGTLPAISGANLTGITTGKVLQVVNAVDASETSTTSTSMVDTGLTADITPSATSSKVLVLVGMNFGILGSTGGIGSRLMRDSTNIRSMSEKSDGHGAGESSSHEAWIAFDYLDSPNTTSATTYKVQFKTNGQVVYTSIDNNVSTITLIEIGA